MGVVSEAVTAGMPLSSTHRQARKATNTIGHPRSPQKVSNEAAAAFGSPRQQQRPPPSRALNRSISTSKLKAEKIKRKAQGNNRSQDNTRPELYEVASPIKSPVKKKQYRPKPKQGAEDKTAQNMAVFEMMNNKSHTSATSVEDKYSSATYSSPVGKRSKIKRTDSDRSLTSSMSSSSKQQRLRSSSKSPMKRPAPPKRASSLRGKTLINPTPPPPPPSTTTPASPPKRQPPKHSNSQRSLMSNTSLGDVSRSSKVVALHDSSQPMTLVALLKRFAAAKTQEGSAKPCLKRPLMNSSNSNKSSSKRHGKSSMAKKKCVTFATNSYNDRVWGLVKAVDHHADMEELDDYWWSDDEMDDIRDTILEQAATVEDEYGETLHRAYQSTIDLPLEGKNDPYSALASSNPATSLAQLLDAVDLCFDSVSQVADAARGLEAAVARHIIIDVKARHREAILGTQERLRAEKGRGLGNAKYAFDDSDLRLLRKQSIQSSRSSRLVATKMGQFDRYQVAPLNKNGESDSSVEISVAQTI